MKISNCGQDQGECGEASDGNPKKGFSEFFFF